MSIESEKKKKEELEQNERPKRVQLETKSLLEDLAQKIATEYGIDILKVKEFIGSKTETKLSSLKSLININTGKSIDVEKFQNVLKGARNVIEKASRDEIEILKGAVRETKLSPETDFYLSSKILSKDQIKRLYSAQNIEEHLLGAAVGIINSAEATIKLLYNIGAGIVQAPYHIYLISTGQAEYDGWKRI